MFVDTQVRPQGEQVDVVAPSKMKLSEAIRIGARLRPQCRGRLYRDDGSCAIGAAFEGAGWKPEVEKYEAKEGASPWHWLEERFGADHSIIDRIWRKNDLWGESRESIADWLEAQGL